MTQAAKALVDRRRFNGGRRTPVGGRPRWRPSPEQRSFAEKAAGKGVPQDVIAALMGVSRNTLAKHCNEELRLGTLAADLQVFIVAFNMAVSGEYPETTFWWLERRCQGW